MQRISDKKFLEIKPDQDHVVGIRVKNGEFFFLAWMENAPRYRIQKAMDPNGYPLDRAGLMLDGDIFSTIQATENYNNMYILYELDDSGNIINETDKHFENEYEEFLSLINCYERNGVSVSMDHDILILNKAELSNFCDILRDGDYILVMEE